jgi:hypothetical protein
MSYMKPGFHEIPAGMLIPKWCAEISSRAGWEGQLSETLTRPGLGRGGRRVEGLREDDLLALGGVGAFSPTLPGHDALLRLLYRFLFSLGVFKRYPSVVGYTNMPFLTMERCIDRMMSSHIKFPTMEVLGGSQSFTVEALAASLPGIIRRLASLNFLREEMLKRLRLKLGAVSRKLALKQPIDQAERSFYVAFGLEDSKRGWTEQEIETNSPPTIYAAESADPLVTETWELFKASTESGPYLRFCTLQSNKNFESLIYTFSPQIAALSYSLGYIRSFGPFDEPHVREAITLPWGRDDQLIAARERYLAFQLGSDNIVPIQPPVQSSVRSAPGFAPQWDLPNVEFHVAIGKNEIAPDDISFYSPWRKRTLTLANGASPISLLTDIALTTERAGESLMDKSSMHEYGFLDRKESEPFLNGQEPSNPSYKENIVFPKPGTQDVTIKEVDLAPLYTRMGTTMYPPAFREFALAPLSWLYTPDKEAEDFISAQLALTYEQKLQAERVIRISHNHAKLSRLLTSDQLPMTEARMRGLCRAISAR